jgi:ABC-type multidrug transport system ATPase subunit
MTTHTIEEAELLGDRLGILVKGQFMSIGTPEELRKYELFFLKYKENILQDRQFLLNYLSQMMKKISKNLYRKNLLT